MQEIFQKLIDNFNFGKFFSDLISGSVLAFSLFLLVAMATGVRVFPAEDIPTLEQQLSVKQDAYGQQSKHVREVLVALTKKDEAIPEAGDTEALEDAAKTAIADSTKDEQKPYVSRLNADLAGMAVIKTAIDELEKKLARARTLTGNVTTDTGLVALFLAVSLICGVIISQVARILFVRCVYRLFMDEHLRPGPASPFKLDTDDLRKTNDYIVTYYYRYAEAGANLAIPLMLIGFIGPWFLTARGLGTGTAAVEGLRWGLFSTGAIVFIAGGFAYKFYRQKLKENMTPVESGRPAPGKPVGVIFEVDGS